MQTGAIILCGGKSSRMGRDKATLPFGPELMLPRTIRLLSEVVDPGKIVVVAAIDQQLPPLPQPVIVARDQHPSRGPLEGIAAGLEAIPRGVEAVYVTSCDVPLLVPAFVTRMFELLEDFDIAVPWEGEQFHPLSAVYRPTVAGMARQLVQADKRRVRFLFDDARTRRVGIDQLRLVDPELQTLMNLNHREDYQAALKIAGFSETSDTSIP